MSRFMLRSADGSKLSEQKEKCKPLTNTMKTPPKKIDQKKNKGSTTNKDIHQKAAETPPVRDTTATAELEDEQQRNAQISMICSLPLSRLTGIIEKLSLKPSSIQDIREAASVKSSQPSSLKYDQNEEETEDGERNNDKYDEEKPPITDADGEGSNSSPLDNTAVKTLCLYCDKKFSTHKMQLKHIEKFHTVQKDRRCSVRNTQIAATSLSPRNKSNNVQSQKSSPIATPPNFPGCSYCKKAKSLDTAESVKDFNGLFLHLTEHHADKYFGCRICVLRFQNGGKLLRHMQNIHKTLPDEQLAASKDHNNDKNEDSKPETASPSEKVNRIRQRHGSVTLASSTTNSVIDQSSVIDAEESILSRLGLTQNRRRLPSNRKGVRLRREAAISDILKSEPATSTAASIGSSPSKARSRTTVKSTNPPSDSDAGIFRVPMRTDTLSTAFDEDFYKEVTSNVRNNLLFHLDGKLADDSHMHKKQDKKPAAVSIGSTFNSNAGGANGQDSDKQEPEIHVATNLTATTAFPTLLTAEQYCGDVVSAKIRRPHTKHSWKWKWDSVKKYKLINEGGKIVKKAKHPMLGLRDLSKLDMWTQLSMRRKYEHQLAMSQGPTTSSQSLRSEKLRLNDQLNVILDTRVLPHIILEQSEQAIIKLENDEFNFSSNYGRQDEGDDLYTSNILSQTFADESFLSLLQLLPRCERQLSSQKLVLSGEWARPRCYLCMCCGSKFEKLKSLEEHKMFRHSNILSTHYEVVGRELLAGNLLQHLFIPKRALSLYDNSSTNSSTNATTRTPLEHAKKAIKYGRLHMSAEEESSDSIQSITNSSATQHTYSLKNTTSTTDDCDTDTKTTLLGDINTVSPSHSLQSSFSSSLTTNSGASQMLHKSEQDPTRKLKCTKCSRKCNSVVDLYRHMLDCSGDYIWSLAKKRKYRYYCGSKKRRPPHKQHLPELRKNKQQKSSKSQSENCTTEESSSNSFKPKTPPRPRPSDAESIKKMLENLPPKRVCKTIFPAVNKVKKTKSKLISKLYNTKVLRKTRARQLSNVVKRSVSTRFSGKPQTKKNAINTVLKSRTQRNIDSSKQNTALQSEINSKIPSQSSKGNTSKTDTLNQNETQVNKEVKSSEKQPQDDKNVESSVVPKDPIKEEALKDTPAEKTNVPEDTVQQQLSTPPSRRTPSPQPNATSVKPVEPLATKEGIQNAESEKKSTATTTPQNENPACGKKRSKRISDCIAMLTGKLEEKLKTESNVSSINEVATETEAKASPAEKKTPKRKAISRRIIKPDILETDAASTQKPKEQTATPIVKPAQLETVSSTKATAQKPATPIIKAVAAPLIVAATKTIPSSPTTRGKAQAATVPISAAAAIVTAKPALPPPPPPVVQPKLVVANVLAPPPPTLVPIPLGLPATLHAVPVPLNMLQSHMPVYLPVQHNINATPLPPAPALSLQIPTQTTPHTSIMPAVPLLPAPPLLQTHLSPVLAPVTPPPYNMEPLNLSNSKGPQKQTTAELRAQRPGFPARRQTICGFEARNLLFYNESEPLDLSKKSREPPLPPVPTALALAPVMSAQQSLAPLELTNTHLKQLPPPPAPQRIQVEDSAIKPSPSSVALPPPLAPPPLPTEAVFNKQFYSNLDLLKIPQIRAAGFVPLPEPVATISNGALNLNAVTNASATVPKSSNKKRASVKPVVEQANTKPAVVAPVTPNSKTKESTTASKKESAAKNKPITKMDEEVINHIDDAINSVINAVKASLPENDEHEQMLTKPASITVEPPCINHPKSIEAVSVSQPEDKGSAIKSKDTDSPSAPLPVQQITVTPKKRTLRSKTVDCRAEVVSLQSVTRNEILLSPTLQNNNNSIPSSMPINQIQPKTCETPAVVNTKSVSKESEEMQTEKAVPAVITPVAVSKVATAKNDREPSNILPKKASPVLNSTNFKESQKEIELVNNNCVPATTVVGAAAAVTVTKVKDSIEPVIKESSVNIIAEENMSNINNTSSGFHSSGTPENGTDVKKKQRRRRKNELAAIVADQLLESFKIDKARRDSLKKLENLAYEKSEDLLLTGMLLMSSTKRNASSAVSFNQTPAPEKASEKRSESLKRQKQNTNQATQLSKAKGKSNENLNQGKSSVSITKVKDVEIAPTVPNDVTTEPTTRKSKRRQSRRKATPLDNENLSKLKSSLESFSIGIEKQLSEIEARNTNVFNAGETSSKKSAATTPPKLASSILRPSILSATLEQPDMQKCLNEGKQSTNFSRDPRLNKNIHKDENPSATTLPNEKNFTPICDLEDDNYLTEIAKNVNEKIMSEENGDFAFANDGFEMANDLQDDSNSKFSRPPTSMSVRSAPNFNDDHSNFGSICDENTNTEVMDMDLDDELSVYTSFSQDLGRGRGRKRRRRRSILLKRRPKKRRSSADLTEKFECELCRKTFFTATSLTKHNMTLAHVSKVSEQEYLMSKSNKTPSVDIVSSSIVKPIPIKSTAPTITETPIQAQSENPEHLSKPTAKKPNEVGKEAANLDTSHRLSLNPDERLFFECCNILKSAETPRVTHAAHDNANHANQSTFTYSEYKNKLASSCAVAESAPPINDNNSGLLRKQATDEKSNYKPANVSKTQDAFRNPVAVSNTFNKASSTTVVATNDRNIHSPTYSQFSAVTNTTSRFKTKAAMKGYENENVDFMLPDEIKSRTTCKLTELAEIALGHEDKPSTPEMPSNLDQPIIGNVKRVVTPEYVTLSVVDSRKNCNYGAAHDNKKNNETQGSTSSKTIMHSSIIKAAVEEHSKAPPANRIIIPERPFKNIGLEEKETITFQKPKTTVSLLIDDNSVSTASYSDRDDFDFGSMSCDEEASNKSNNEKNNPKSNSSESSSSRATAKTFENKSLIMGRIFKNASTKNKTTVKSVGVQKDNTPKADLDQIFDELRGEAAAKIKSNETPVHKEVVPMTYDEVRINAKSPVITQNPEPRRKPKSVVKKPKPSKKSQKDYSKLQSELGMSPEDIEKLIDDGQRKSKRRCATNQSKKMVEMWSSDEYEEFLSTKDIIALIEEKEKQEQRKKRKPNIYPSNVGDYKGKPLVPPPPTETGETKEKGSRLPPALDDEKVIAEKQKPAPSSTKLPVKDKEKPKPKHSTAIVDSLPKSKEWSKQQDDSTNTSKTSKTKKVNKNTRQTSNRGGHTEVPSNKTDAPKNEASTEILALQADDNLCLSDLKQNNNYSSRHNKTKKDKSYKESVNSSKSHSRETYTDPVESKKRNCNSSSSKKSKGKRKPQAEKSPIRKRPAADKLYYWSSSSDEDFGRINAAHNHEPEYESSEQYQKHGWIVGDSHKKLVTLLAIAKGNKKVESCGVKKNVSKRKS